MKTKILFFVAILVFSSTKQPQDDRLTLIELTKVLERMNEKNDLQFGDYYLVQKDSILVYINKEYWRITDTVIEIPHINSSILITNSKCDYDSVDIRFDFNDKNIKNGDLYYDIHFSKKSKFDIRGFLNLTWISDSVYIYNYGTYFYRSE